MVKPVKRTRLQVSIQLVRQRRSRIPIGTCHAVAVFMSEVVFNLPLFGLGCWAFRVIALERMAFLEKGGVVQVRNTDQLFRTVVGK